MSLSDLVGWNQQEAASTGGSACGSSDKPAEAPAACGSADKPEEKPAACGAGDKK